VRRIRTAARKKINAPAAATAKAICCHATRAGRRPAKPSNASNPHAPAIMRKLNVSLDNHLRIFYACLLDSSIAIRIRSIVLLLMVRSARRPVVKPIVEAMRRTVSILLATLAAAVVLPPSTMAGSAVAVSISINRHPEPKRRINWAAVNAASRQIDVAKGQLRQAAKAARRTVEATSEYDTAVVNLHAAQALHQRAFAEATSAVELSHEFIDLDLKLQSAVAAVEKQHGEKRRHPSAANPQTMFHAAANVMRIRARITDLRKSTLASDVNVEAARYALVDAGAELRRLRDDARSRVAQSEAWQSARQQLDVARKQYASAG